MKNMTTMTSTVRPSEKNINSPAPSPSWARSDSKVISSIAKQALLLNVIVFLLVAGSALLWLTILLIPAVVIFWILLALAAIALPIVGAIKAFDGVYYRYPVVGVGPS